MLENDGNDTRGNMRFVLFLVFGFWIFFSSIFASPATRNNARPSRTPSSRSLWRNRLARSAVNRKVGGSSPPRDDAFFFWQLRTDQKVVCPSYKLQKRSPRETTWNKTAYTEEKADFLLTNDS